MKSMYYWLGKHVHARYGTWIFALLVFIEGFFVVPVTTLLTFYCLENRKKAFMYAAIATSVSALAALVGYSLGALLWKTLGQNFIYYLISPKTFDYLVEQYKNYQAATIIMISLTPVPFKALTLTAGFCQLPLIPFICFSVIGRGLRFFFIAGATFLWGHHLQYYIDKYFYYLAAAFAALCLGMWFLLH